LAVLAGGTQLSAPAVSIQTDASEYTGTVTDVEYLNRRITLDRAWPECAAGLFEIGTPKRRASYSALSVHPTDQGCTLQLDGGADYFRSRITSVNEAAGEVVCSVKPSMGALPGLTHDFTATNDARTQSWRAQYLDNSTWHLTGAPVREADFGSTRALRIWEYGKGDTVRQCTQVSTERIGPGVFAIQANTGFSLTLPGARMEVSTNQADWRNLPVKKGPTGCTARIEAADLSAQDTIYVRITE
jgi:hypothetical protein